MKATGIVRRIDDLGRVVIPKETRRMFGIAEGDPLEIYVDGKSIILKKYERGCTFCPNMDNLVEFGGQHICRECIEALKK